jgi:Ala-tRNA(Pro) deacylase
MATPQKIKDYLSANNVKYWQRTHPVAYSAQEIAAVDHIPGREMAKTVLLRADDRLILAVLSGDRVINFDVLKEALGCDKLMLASLEELRELFPGCWPGAMPPLGKLYGISVYCDKALARQLEIEFNAGTHIDTIRMPFSEFERLELPIVLNFSLNATGQPLKRVA